MKQTKNFPNGVTSYLETHFEIAQAITTELAKDTPSGLCLETQMLQGHTGLYELAEKLADEFEALNAGRTWDGEFYDEIEAFCKAKLNP